MMSHKVKKGKAKTSPPITIKELDDLPYADNFDLPREEEKLRAVYEHERAGGNFDIRKAFAFKGMRAKTIATVADFPGYFDLVDIVEEQYGGGTYNIHAAGSARVFKTYVLDGPPEFNVGRPQREKSPVQRLKEELEVEAVHRLREMAEEDPKLGQAIGAAFAKKHLGIEFPPELPWYEKMVRGEAERNPKYRAELVKAGLRELGVEFPEEEDPIEEQIRKFEQFNQIEEALREGPRGPTGTLARFLKDVAPALPEIVKMINEIRGAGTAGQVGPALETPPDQSKAKFPIGHVPPFMVPSVPTAQTATPPPKPGPDSIPAETGQMPPVGQQEDRPIDLAHIWPPLSRVDWAALETGVHGDPGEFIQSVFITAYEKDSLYHHQLSRLFQDNEPDAIIGEMSRLAESLAVESGEEYEVAVLVLKHLAESEEGLLWLAQVHLAAQVIGVKLKEFAAGGVRSMENGETDGNTLDEGDEFDGPMLI